MDNYFELLKSNITKTNELLKATVECYGCKKQVRHAETVPFSYYRDNEGNNPYTPDPMCSEECRRTVIDTGLYMRLMMRTPFGEPKYIIPTRYMDDPFGTDAAAWLNSAIPEQRKIFAQITEWWFTDRTKGWLFYGSTGTGKSCLAALLTRQYRREEKCIRWVSGYTLTSEAPKEWAKGEEVAPFIQKYVTADLMVIDELAEVDLKNPHIMSLIVQRHEQQRPIIFTTNSKLTALEGKMQSHIFSRIMDGCVPVPFVWKDQRGRRNG